MAYSRQGPQGEVVKLRDEITDEVNRDAEHIAGSIFGNVDNQPDLARVSDEQLMNAYRRAYQNGDRQFLQAEARRDPNQFLKIADKLGVQRQPSQPAAPPPSPMPLPAPMPVQPMLPPLAPAPMPMVTGPPLGPQSPPALAPQPPMLSVGPTLPAA